MKKNHTKAPAVFPSKRRNAASEPRRRRPSPSNDQLLEKAFELFVELGYDKTSLEAITAAAGLAKRTVYIRYHDKEKLFIASVRHAIKKWIVPIETLRAAETPDLEETLVKIGDLLLNSVLSPSGMRLLQLTTAVSRQHSEIAAHNVEEGTKPTLNYLAGMFEKRLGSQLQWVSGAAGAAMAFMNLVVSGPANFAANGVILDRFSIERNMRSSVQLFLYGVTQSKGKTNPALTKENLHLKQLLAEMMIELDMAKQALRQARKLEPK